MIKLGPAVVSSLCAVALSACATIEDYDLSSQDVVAAGCVVSAATDLIVQESPDTTSDLTNSLCMGV